MATVNFTPEQLQTIRIALSAHIEWLYGYDEDDEDCQALYTQAKVVLQVVEASLLQ